MIRRDVQQYSHKRVKHRCSVKLEAAYFQHVPIVVPGGNLTREADTNIAGKRYVVSCFTKQVIREQRGCGCSVGARYSEYVAPRIAEGKLDCINNINSRFHLRSNHRCSRRYSRTFHHEVAIQNAVKRMRSFFECYASSRQLIFILVGNDAAIRNKNIIPLRFRQKGGSCSAFARTQYGNALP